MKRCREESLIDALRDGVECLSVSSTISNRELVCRDAHVKTIIEFLEERVHYTLQIFGMPGTGKTATVNCAFLSFCESKEEIASIFFLNGYVIQQTSDIYWTLLQHLGRTRWNSSSSLKCNPNQAASVLEKKLRSTRELPPLCLIVLDEADKMVEKYSKAVFKIIDWLSLPFVNLKLITISNTMDLSMDAKTRSRLDLTRKLVFEPYTVEELKRILSHRVSHISPKLFSDVAVNLLCQQVASQYGDVRRLLQTAASTVCSVLMEITSEKNLNRKDMGAEIVGLQELHSVVRQTFHDRSIEFLKLLASPVVFIVICVIAKETENLFYAGDREFRIPLSKVYSQACKHFPRDSSLPLLSFFDRIEILRQVGMIDTSIGVDGAPVSGSDGIAESYGDVFVSLLYPHSSIINSCKLHDLWGSKIGKVVFA